jgi:hypothetical protein
MVAQTVSKVKIMSGLLQALNAYIQELPLINHFGRTCRRKTRYRRRWGLNARVLTTLIVVPQLSWSKVDCMCTVASFFS